MWVGALTGSEVPGGVGGALLVMQQREGVQLVGGTRCQLAERVRPVAPRPRLHCDVALSYLGALGQRDHLPYNHHLGNPLGFRDSRLKRLVGLVAVSFLYNVCRPSTAPALSLLRCGVVASLGRKRTQE